MELTDILLDSYHINTYLSVDLNISLQNKEVYYTNIILTLHKDL